MAVGPAIPEPGKKPKKRDALQRRGRDTGSSVAETEPSVAETKPPVQGRGQGRRTPETPETPETPGAQSSPERLPKSLTGAGPVQPSTQNSFFSDLARHAAQFGENVLKRPGRAVGQTLRGAADMVNNAAEGFAYNAKGGPLFFHTPRDIANFGSGVAEGAGLTPPATKPQSDEATQVDPAKPQSDEATQPVRDLNGFVPTNRGGISDGVFERVTTDEQGRQVTEFSNVVDGQNRVTMGDGRGQNVEFKDPNAGISFGQASEGLGRLLSDIRGERAERGQQRALSGAQASAQRDLAAFRSAVRRGAPPQELAALQGAAELSAQLASSLDQNNTLRDVRQTEARAGVEAERAKQQGLTARESRQLALDAAKARNRMTKDQVEQIRTLAPEGRETEVMAMVSRAVPLINKELASRNQEGIDLSALTQTDMFLLADVVRNGLGVVDDRFINFGPDSLDANAHEAVERFFAKQGSTSSR